MQLVLVYAIVIAAALYVAYKIYRMIARKDGCSGCTDCPCCGEGKRTTNVLGIKKRRNSGRNACDKAGCNRNL